MKKIIVVCMAVQVSALPMQAAYCQDAKPVQKQSKGARTAKTPGGEARYQEALQFHRQKNDEAALSILDELRRAYPDDPRYLYDYIAIASSSGKPDLALEAAASSQLDGNAVPAFVLEALGASQRQKKLYDAALITYDLDAGRFPDRIEARTGKIATLIEAKRYPEAEALLNPLFEKHPSRPDVIENMIRLGEATNQPMKTLIASEELLKKEPESRYAQRMRFYSLKKLGAIHLALQVTPQHVLNETEVLAAKRDQLAFDLRWARINLEQPTKGDRWKEMDAVIAKMSEMCKQAGTDAEPAIIAQGSCGDLIEALSNRHHVKEAIALYEKMQANRWTIYPYMQLAAANAYLEDRQPEKARDMYAALLEKDPKNFDVRQNYIYALLECDQFDLAYSEVDKLAADTSEWINPTLLGFRDPNPDYILAQKNSAMVRAFTNRQADGENILQALAQRSPGNQDVTRALASVYHLRGWPRRAENELEDLAANNPPDPWTSLGLFENRMPIGDFRGAEQELNVALQLRPEEPVIQQAQTEWKNHNLNELNVEARIGRSSGGNAAGPNGIRDILIDATLFSRPLLYNWRVLAHTQLARDTFTNMTVIRNSVGAGVEYRNRDYTALAEVRRVGNTGAGLALDQTYHFNDYWSINGLLESRSLAAPVRAHADGVSAQNILIGLTYRASESRSVVLSTNQMDLSDGNRRHETSLTWTERLKATPTYLLDASVEYYASRNSLQNALINYFNPVSDQYTGVSLNNEWLQFQRYGKSLKHVLTVGVGRYAQQNFVTRDAYSIRYGQIYRASDKLELRYGIGRNGHPYDGVQTTENSLDFAADWLF